MPATKSASKGNVRSFALAPGAIPARLIERYGELKRQAPDCLLLMQVGAFLKALGDDARAVSAITGLKLQMAGDVDEPVVVGGFPKSGLDAYVGRLVRAGHSVALALQDETKERHLEEVIRVSQGEGRKESQAEEGRNDGAV